MGQPIRYLQKYFVNVVKKTNPSKWYSIAKRLGASDTMHENKIILECLKGKTDKESVEEIASHYSKVSQEYSPISLSSLPSFLPSLPPPQVFEWEVNKRIKAKKKTKSTLKIDLPHKLLKEFSVELSFPLTNIYNTCLSEGVYPSAWKHEYVTPVPKGSNLSTLSDLRKMASTSIFSFHFERFLKEWIVHDVWEK